ncbi:MAG TPA: DUF4954 family protein [Planctomycetota bacterium]|jgi:hypothetical protein
MTVHFDEKPVPAEAVRKAIQESSFLKGVAAVREMTPASRGLRQLSSTEIDALKAENNAAEDWTRVWVPKTFNPRKIIDCYFCGDVSLGEFRDKVVLDHGLQLGSGVYNCTLQDVSVGDNALLRNTGLIANYHIGARAVVQSCGRIVCSGRTSFGNGQHISLGLETQGRDTALYAEITCDVAAQIAADRVPAQVEAYERAIAEYVVNATSGKGVIEAGAVVQNTLKLLDVYVGPETVIDAAVSIENSTILSGSDEGVYIGAGAAIRNSLIQWGCRVENHAVVESSVCCEFSSVDTHASLKHSLWGQNSVLSSGECVNSLVGPFVGMHHQSLLISAFWPQGKGNLGYGANVGSNHTGKAPDQEIWPGEGVFFGLGVNVKFPADFSSAPYSLIAAGVTLMPQRVEMPFSLINVRAESIPGVSPAYNEIFPGWVLSDNIYAIRRNERKYAVRNRASRALSGFEVFRPDIVDQMVRARTALQNAERALTPARAAAQRAVGAVDAAQRPVYTDKDIPGLGKNFMREIARAQGIKAYTFYIRYYALKGLYFGVKFCLEHDRDLSKVLEPGYIGDHRYEHELALLLAEFPGLSVKAMLRELADAYHKMAHDTLLAKEKDDFRGVRIIPDYASIHLPAKDDTFVRITVQEAAEYSEEIDGLMKQIKN